jgi:hypothetical protein
MPYAAALRIMPTQNTARQTALRGLLHNGFWRAARALAPYKSTAVTNFKIPKPKNVKILKSKFALQAARRPIHSSF